MENLACVRPVRPAWHRPAAPPARIPALNFEEWLLGDRFMLSAPLIRRHCRYHRAVHTLKQTRFRVQKSAATSIIEIIRRIFCWIPRKTIPSRNSSSTGKIPITWSYSGWMHEAKSGLMSSKYTTLYSTAGCAPRKRQRRSR